MGVPTSAVGYTAAMSRREDHEVHKDMWWGHWTNKKILICVFVIPKFGLKINFYLNLPKFLKHEV